MLDPVFRIQWILLLQIPVKNMYFHYHLQSKFFFFSFSFLFFSFFFFFWKYPLEQSRGKLRNGAYSAWNNLPYFPCTLEQALPSSWIVSANLLLFSTKEVTFRWLLFWQSVATLGAGQHIKGCCGQLWVRHMICGQTCGDLYHFTFLLIVLGYPQDPNRSS